MFGFVEKLWDMGQTAFWALLGGTAIYEYFKGYGVGGLKLPTPHMVDQNFVDQNHTPRTQHAETGRVSETGRSGQGYDVRPVSMDEPLTPQTPRTGASSGRRY